MRDNKQDKNATIAAEILAQLGGNKFIAMTGARGIYTMEKGLALKFPGAYTKKHINFIRIFLDPSDTYTVEFWTYRKMKGEKIAEYAGIYADMLQGLFRAETGLDTHL